MSLSGEGWNARYEPRLKSGGSWYRCHHQVQARLKMADGVRNKAFPFQFDKDGTDKQFKDVLKTALTKASEWRVKEITPLDVD
eukprot:32278-Pyramimonas_sp.AAC.2